MRRLQKLTTNTTIAKVILAINVVTMVVVIFIAAVISYNVAMIPLLIVHPAVISATLLYLSLTRWYSVMPIKSSEREQEGEAASRPSMSLVVSLAWSLIAYLCWCATQESIVGMGVELHYTENLGAISTILIACFFWGVAFVFSLLALLVTSLFDRAVGESKKMEIWRLIIAGIDVLIVVVVGFFIYCETYSYILNEHLLPRLAPVFETMYSGYL